MTTAPLLSSLLTRHEQNRTRDGASVPCTAARTGRSGPLLQGTSFFDQFKFLWDDPNHGAAPRRAARRVDRTGRLVWVGDSVELCERVSGWGVLRFVDC